jgi:hypothetical protein
MSRCMTPGIAADTKGMEVERTELDAQQQKGENHMTAQPPAPAPTP